MPRIIIKDSTPALTIDQHKQLLQNLKADETNTQVRASAVVAGDKIAGKTFPLFNNADFLALYEIALQNYFKEGDAATTRAENLGFSGCQVLNLKEQFILSQKVRTLYLQSLNNIGLAWRERNIYLDNYEQINLQQLKHEDQTAKFAREALYGIFNKILTIIITDYQLQLTMQKEFEKNLSELETNVPSAPAKIEKIINWFENGLKLNDDHRKTLEIYHAIKNGTLSKEQLKTIEKWQIALWFQKKDITLYENKLKELEQWHATKSGLKLNEEQSKNLELYRTALTEIATQKSTSTYLITTLKIFKLYYRSDYQLSRYAIPELIKVNALYNQGLVYNATRPAKDLPVSIRARCADTVKDFAEHFQKHSDDADKFNTTVVEIPGKPDANPQKIDFFSLIKIAEEMGLKGFGGYIKLWLNSLLPQSSLKDEQKVESTQVLFDNFDNALLIVGLSNLFAIKGFKDAIKKSSLASLINELTPIVDNYSQNILKITKTQENMQKHPEAALQLMSEYQTLEASQKELMEKFIKIRTEKLESLSQKQLNEFRNIINNLDTKTEENFYGNIAIGFMSLLHNKKSWTGENTTEFGNRLSYIVINVLQDPVVRLLTPLTPRERPKANPKKATTPQEILDETIDKQTAAIQDYVLQLYLNWCVFNAKEEQAELEKKNSSLSEPSKEELKEEKKQIRETNKKVESIKKELTIIYGKELGEINQKVSQISKDSKIIDPNLVARLLKLLSHFIATENKELYKKALEVIGKIPSFWQHASIVVSNLTPFCCAVHFKHSSKLRELFEKVDPKLHTIYTNQNFVTVDGQNCSLLGFASAKNYTKVMKILLERGANPFTKNADPVVENCQDQQTALELAVKHGNFKAVQVILQSYSKLLDKKDSSPDLIGQINTDIENAQKLTVNNSTIGKLLEETKTKLQAKKVEKKPESSPQAKAEKKTSLPSTQPKPQSPTTKPKSASATPKSAPATPIKVANLISKFDGGTIVVKRTDSEKTLPENPHKVLQAVAEGNKEISLKSILKEENKGLLTKFLKAQIAERSFPKSTTTTTYSSKNLRPVLSDIATYLKNDEFRYVKLIEDIAGSYYQIDRCRTFIDKLTISADVKKAKENLETNIRTEGSESSDTESIDSLSM